MIKKLLLSLACCFVCICTLNAQSLPDNQLILPSETFTLSFCWQGDTIGSRWEPNAALLIPVKLKNCPRRFHMQFDLGSPYSLLYKNKVKDIQDKYPGSIPSIKANENIENFTFQVDQTSITGKEIPVHQFDDSLIDWKNENSIEIIGTIGADLIDGEVAIIDYPNKKLTLSETVPDSIERSMSFDKFIYSHRRVLLPAKIKDKVTILYFDTGSSMFELLTDKATSEYLAIHDAKPVQYNVKSWDKYMIANTLASNSSIEIANISIPVNSITYMEGVSDSQIDQMSKMGIGGMTGNKLFLNYILVLDTKNSRFGIKSTQEQ